MLFDTKTTVGLDIGSSYLKAVQLNYIKSGYELEAFDLIPIESSVIEDSAIAKPDILIDSIKELFRKAKIKTKKVVISMSGYSSTVAKIITIPKMPEEELVNSIKLEAEQYVPFSIDEINLDFHIVGPNIDDKDQIDVMLVAAKTNVINGYINAVKEAALTPVVMDIDAFAFSNTYESNHEIDKEKNIALINIGANSLIINILKGGISIYIMDRPVGTSVLTDALQNKFQISYEAAEKLIKGETVKDVLPGAVDEVLQNESREIVNEISNAIDYFTKDTFDESVEKLVIGGGGALIKGFKEILSEYTLLDVSVIEPFNSIKIPKKFDEEFISEIGPIASIAVGLATRRMGDR